MDEKLKDLNDKKVTAFNIIRQISSVNEMAKKLTDQYAKLNQDITKLEQEYMAEAQKNQKTLDKPKK